MRCAQQDHKLVDVYTGCELSIKPQALCIPHAVKTSDGAWGASDRLRTSVDTLTAQLDQLEDDYANKRLTRAQAQKELNDIDDASASLKHRLVAMQDGTDKFQQYSASTEDLAKGTDLAIDQARVASLDGQIAEMKSRNDDLEHEYTLLAERRKALVLQ